MESLNKISIEEKPIIGVGFKKCSSCGDIKSYNHFPPTPTGTRFGDECSDCISKNAKPRLIPKIVGHGKPVFKFPTEKKEIKETEQLNRIINSKIVLEDKKMTIKEEAIEIFPKIEKLFETKDKIIVKDLTGIVFPTYKSSKILNELSDQGLLIKTHGNKNQNFFTLKSKEQLIEEHEVPLKDKVDYLEKARDLVSEQMDKTIKSGVDDVIEDIKPEVMKAKKLVNDLLENTNIKTTSNEDTTEDSKGNPITINNISQVSPGVFTTDPKYFIFDLLYTSAKDMTITPSDNCVNANFVSQKDLMTLYTLLPEDIREEAIITSRPTEGYFHIEFNFI